MQCRGVATEAILSATDVLSISFLFESQETMPVREDEVREDEVQLGVTGRIMVRVAATAAEMMWQGTCTFHALYTA